jgi:hypothetical protein
MPTRDPIPTPEIDIALIVPVYPIKYDSCTLSRGATEAMHHHEEPVTHMNNSLRSTGEGQRKGENSMVRKRQSPAVASDITAVRIPT